VKHRSRASEGEKAGTTAAARLVPTSSERGTRSDVRHMGGGRRLGTSGRPPVDVTGSTEEGLAGGLPAVAESSTGGDLVAGPPAREEGSI